MKGSLVFRGFGICIVLFYVLGWIFPNFLWGAHQLALIPPIFSFIIMSFSGLCIIAPERVFFFIHPKKQGIKRKMDLTQIVTVSILAGILYFSFPMVQSLYGDAELFKEEMGVKTESFSESYPTHLLSLNVFHPKIGNLTVISGVRLLSYAFDVDHKTVFRWIGALFGSLFIGLWLWFIHGYFDSSLPKIVFSAVVLTAPFTQFFFGFEEIYAPSFFFTSGYLILLVLYLKKQSNRRFIGLCIFLFLSLKTHSSSVLLIPSFIVLAYAAFQNKGSLERFITIKNIGLFILMPIYLVGAYIYFFILKDHIDPRFVNETVDIYSRLFLPIYKPEPPLDRYTLFCLYHVFDFVNLIFMWSAPALFFIFGFLSTKKKSEWRKEPSILLVGLTLLLMASLYFMVNPLMSMPIDIDYFSLPGTVLIMFSMVLIKHHEGLLNRQWVSGLGIGICLLSLPALFVNAYPNSLSKKFEFMGDYIFKSYWIRSAGDIRAGLNLVQNDTTEYRIRLTKKIDDLKPYAIKGNDKEYAILLHELAKHYRTVEKNPKKALQVHMKVLDYNPHLEANFIGLMESHHTLGNYKEAFVFSKELVRFEYPDRQRALRIALECALLSQSKDEFVALGRKYLLDWEDPDLSSILENLDDYFAE